MDEPIEELKPLPSIVKYAFLDTQHAKPVIISSQLNEKKEKRLLEVLQWNEQAIGWTLENLRGLDPSHYVHIAYFWRTSPDPSGKPSDD